MGRKEAVRKSAADNGETSSGAGRILPDYQSLTDEKLAGLYANGGDGEAFNRIAAKYSDIVLGFALKMIRDPHDAEEVRQDVFMSLLENMGSFKGNSRFSTWLYRITLNTCYMKLNKRRRMTRNEVPIDTLGMAADAAAARLCGEKRPDELAIYREIMELIGEAVRELPERSRIVFNLRDIKGFSNAEAAEMLGMSESAVKSRILRSRLFIRERVSTRFREWNVRCNRGRRLPDTPRNRPNAAYIKADTAGG